MIEKRTLILGIFAPQIFVEDLAIFENLSPHSTTDARVADGFDVSNDVEVMSKHHRSKSHRPTRIPPPFNYDYYDDYDYYYYHTIIIIAPPQSFQS